MEAHYERFLHRTIGEEKNYRIIDYDQSIDDLAYHCFICSYSFIPFGIILPVIMITVDVFVFRGQNLEFEYLYVNGDLDIDKIMGKAKRKRVFSAAISDLEILAPSGSEEVKRIQVTKTLNFSSFDSEKKTYDLIVQQNGQKIKVILSQMILS